MRHVKLSAILLACLVGAPLVAAAQDAVEAETGTFSLATNPAVMVYIDGERIGMSPIINRRLAAGDHRVTLLLILPTGNRLRADYRAVVAAGRDTVASLDLARDPPSEGEVRTLAAPPPPRRDPPPPPPPPTPPAAGGGADAGGRDSWATSPGRPRTGPVTVADIQPALPPTPPRPTPAPTPPAPPPPPEPQFGLTREMVREGMEAMRPAVERCLQGAAGLVQVRLNIQPDGGVADVEVQGAYRGTTIGECIERALPDEAAFPIYTGDPVPVVYPYRVVPR